MELHMAAGRCELINLPLITTVIQLRGFIYYIIAVCFGSRHAGGSDSPSARFAGIQYFAYLCVLLITNKRVIAFHMRTPLFQALTKTPFVSTMQ
jgi:hypothetical protein